MKEVLKNGVSRRLFPERGGGGLTGETFLVEYNKQKYVLRKCDSLAKARYYQSLSDRFGKYGFFPKFLGRFGKNVFYEYIEGRDLRKRGERLENVKQVGGILSRINDFEFKGSFADHTNTFLDELESGKYKSLGKVEASRKKRGLGKIKKKVISTNEKGCILQVLDRLKKDIGPKIVYECGDPTPGNFRIRDGRVYLVDIESIKPRYKGFGISKIFLKWVTNKNKRDKFIAGYGESKFKFYDSKYKDFMDLNFLIQRAWFEVQTGKDYEKSLVMIRELMGRLGG